MIGLGSNRLSVCRRGGMSVTQAGRGGMEWLAGGRMPSWANPYLPYSKAAGEALVAQFPTQWPTILDYGFAHPEIVGYMNAYAPEDAKIAYSLVAGLGIRKITPVGNAYFKTGYKANGNTGFYIDFYSKADASMCVFGGRTRHDNKSYALTPYNSVSGYNGQFYYADTSTKVYYNAEIYTNNRCKLSYDAATHKFTNAAGTVINTSSLTFTCDYDIYLFGDNQGNSMIEHFGGDICVIRFDELGVDKRYYIPFVRNGQNEILDLVTGQLAERVGSFTISETSPS